MEITERRQNTITLTTSIERSRDTIDTKERDHIDIGRTLRHEEGVIRSRHLPAMIAVRPRNATESEDQDRRILTKTG